MVGIIKVKRHEYREGNLAKRDWRITFFGIPIFVANLTSTNNQAIKQLTVLEENKKVIQGF